MLDNGLLKSILCCIYCPSSINKLYPLVNQKESLYPSCLCNDWSGIDTWSNMSQKELRFFFLLKRISSLFGGELNDWHSYLQVVWSPSYREVWKMSSEELWWHQFLVSSTAWFLQFNGQFQYFFNSLFP
jgi:hypothetical protein